MLLDLLKNDAVIVNDKFALAFHFLFLFFCSQNLVKASNLKVIKQSNELYLQLKLSHFQMNFDDLPKQPSIFLSYWNVGKLLYGALLLFMVETIFYYVKFNESLVEGNWYIILFWLWSLLFSFIHMFLVMADVWSRFQNYKRAKDQIFQHGFKTKIAINYTGSKCQRMALMAAAKELGMDRDVERFYKKLGICWYHFIPKFMLKDPLFLFRSYFWSRTFLEGYYSPKFDFRNQQKVLY